MNTLARVHQQLTRLLEPARTPRLPVHKAQDATDRMLIARIWVHRTHILQKPRSQGGLKKRAVGNIET